MSAHLTEALRQDLSRRFEEHGRAIYGSPDRFNSSPLYAHLSIQVAADYDVLELMAAADRATQVSNLLFGAVHYLLLGGVDDPLAGFYPDLTPTPGAIGECYSFFRSFCLRHADAIRGLVTTRRVQTNEVGRCAVLLPAFTLAARRVAPRPLALLEIGASAGLHLICDAYAYDYGPDGRVGQPDAPVLIRCGLRGSRRPAIPAVFPAIGWRLGIDINPIDVRDDDAARWLQALIWPEHIDRADLLRQALRMRRERPVEIMAGSAPDLLPAALAQVPPDAALCVYHSYTLNQMPVAVRERTLAAIAQAALERPLFRVSQEWYGDQPEPRLELHAYDGTRVDSQTLACCESHGRWVEWLAESV